MAGTDGWLNETADSLMSTTIARIKRAFRSTNARSQEGLLFNGLAWGGEGRKLNLPVVEWLESLSISRFAKLNNSGVVGQRLVKKKNEIKHNQINSDAHTLTSKGSKTVVKKTNEEGLASWNDWCFIDFVPFLDRQPACRLSIPNGGHQEKYGQYFLGILKALTHGLAPFVKTCRTAPRTTI